MSRLIVHIGTGKTATTTLQNSILSILHSNNYIVYLNKENIALKEIQKLFVLSESLEDKSLKEAVSIFRESLKSTMKVRQIPHFISLESLHGCDPGTWRDKLILNRELFSDLADSVEIMITLRPTKSYLDAVYMQMIHQGLVYLNPENFFLNSNNYKIARRYLGEISRGNEIFCVDNLIYEELFKIYQKNFSSTYCFLMEEVINLEFLQCLQIKIPDDLKNKLLSTYSVKNRSYSCVAFNLTKYRELLLRKVGLRSVSSLDREKMIQINNLLSNKRKSKNSDYITISTKKTRSIIKSFAQKISKRFISLIQENLSWRMLMQNYANRFLPYKRKEFDYGFIELSKVDKRNSIFLSKTISERVYISKNSY